MAECSASEEQVCPLCGGDNACAMTLDSDGAEQCWCMHVAVSPQVLARVPDELKNKACLCQACAKSN